MERLSLTSRLGRRLTASLATLALLFTGTVPSAAASSWDPTLLVNTESFQVIDDGDGTTNIILQFGDTANEELRWDVTNLRFEFTDDVHVQGNITATGTLTVDGAVVTKSTLDTVGNITTDANLTINEDNGAADAVLTFGNDAAAETLTFSDTNEYFVFSDDVHATGNLTTSGTLVVENNATFKSTLTLNGVTYTFPVGDGSASGKVLATDGAGTLVWTDRDTFDTAGLDARYVNRSGDTMTGDLVIKNGGTLTVSGAIATDDNLTINRDNAAADATITFGNDAGVETITFSDTNEAFTVSDDLNTTGNLAASGTLTVDGAVVTKSTLDTVGNITTDANLTINEDNGAADAVLTFGNDAAAETLTFSDTNEYFVFSDDVHATGNLTTSGTLVVENNATFKSTLTLNGVTYTFPVGDGSASGKVLATDGAGTLVWTDRDTFDTAGLDARYVNRSGDTMTGDLVIKNGGTLTVSGAIATDDNLTINRDNAAADATITFGNDAGVETITFSDTTNAFEVSDDLNATGNLAASGTLTVDGAVVTKSTLDTVGNITTDANLTINEDNGAADAVLTFGNDAAAETLTFSDTNEYFVFSDDVHATGNLTTSGTLVVENNATFKSTLTLNGVTYTFPVGDGSASGKVLATDGAGTLVWTDRDTFDTAGLDARYVNRSGDTMTGDLVIKNGGTLTVSGAIATDDNLTINRDNAAADATITFGNDAGVETITFSDTTNAFEVSDDLNATGNVTAASLSGGSLTVSSGGVNINGLQYQFTNTPGTNGQVLTNDGNGNLTWAAGTLGNASGTIFLSPEYPHAVYNSPGAASIGQLTYDFDGTNFENHYRWSTSKSTNQSYEIVFQATLPDNFVSWDGVAPIVFRHRTSAANADIDVTMTDTANAAVTLTGGANLVSAAWATATITGPEAAGAYTAGDNITITITLNAGNPAAFADAGWIELNFDTTSP